ncbi:MAG: pilus assembly protein CpaC [Deltaproteobacteria bacterium HGW-Deltaproteobacteria-13]|jgi:pilus assembly protein CpaC|nr:MAG: pilus assembly protein CpaC [Deltaproteobacteria bacterium HGW-Deltaproteobacteria-13]
MRLIKRENRTGVFLIILAFCLLLPIAVMAAGPERVSINPMNPENLTVTSGKSMILESQNSIKRFSIAEPKIADVIVLTPKQVYLTGKTPGVTSLTFWGEGDKLSAVFDVEVTPNVASLKDKLHKVFPNEKGIQVTTSQDSIVLTGSVSNAATMAQVLSIAESYSPSGKDKQKLINLMEVGGVQQVMLEVRVSEMSKSLGRKLGVNFSAIGRAGRDGTLSFVSALTSPATIPAGVLAGTKISRDVTWTALVDALKDRGLIKVLAEPTLITMSGKKANFLAGGEYPVPIPQAQTATNQTIAIEYKTFGVSLNFTPTVLGNGRISMDVAPEVSDLDFSNSVLLSGYVVPGLTVRRVSTSVELADGQSFAVAGLLKDDVRESVDKIPFLGDIPVLGVLFRSSEFKKNETELVIIVTPHLVKPVDLAKQTLPTDQFVEPNDLEFYLLGREEGLGGGRTRTNADSGPPVAGGGGLDGDFGHILP